LVALIFDDLAKKEYRTRNVEYRMAEALRASFQMGGMPSFDILRFLVLRFCGFLFLVFMLFMSWFRLKKHRLLTFCEAITFNYTQDRPGLPKHFLSFLFSAAACQGFSL